MHEYFANVEEDMNNYPCVVSYLEGDIVVKESTHQPLEHESVQFLQSGIRQSSEDILYGRRQPRRETREEGT